VSVHRFALQLSKREVIKEMTRRRGQYYSPVRIDLFGSEARGEAGPDSDLDFLVVVPDDTPRPLQDSREIVVFHLDSLTKRPDLGKARQINASTESSGEPYKGRDSRADVTIRSPTSSSPKVRSTSLSETKHPRTIFASWRRSVRADRRSTAASLPAAK
jgi:predicted nucleotidyltransferase